MKTLRELGSLEGRVAMVLGGAGHVGETACRALAELGARVIVSDLDESGCVRVVDSLDRDYGSVATVQPADITDAESVSALANGVERTHGRLDVLIHAAALVGTSLRDGWTTPFDTQDPELWARALDTNTTSLFRIVQACRRLLDRREGASIVAVGSIYGCAGPDMRLYEGLEMGNPAAYAASKGALVALVSWLATVLAPRIRVNLLTPGGIWREQPAAFVERYEQRTPLGRMASEEDLLGAFAYLASDLSAYVTGQELTVDGGWTVW